MAKINLLKYHADLSDTEWLSVVEFYKKNTARQTANHFGLHFTQALVTALARAHDKNAGHGGSRPDSGNRKGDNAISKEVSHLLGEAQAIMKLNQLPEVDNNDPKSTAKESANVLRGTVAKLKGIIEKLAAISAILVVLYVIFC